MKKLPVNFFFSLVSLTPLINLLFRKSPRIFVTIRNGLYFIFRGPKKLIHEKNLKSKSRVRLPLQIVMAVGRAYLNLKRANRPSQSSAGCYT
jgi:hypothetical protein